MLCWAVLCVRLAVPVRRLLVSRWRLVFGLAGVMLLVFPAVSLSGSAELAATGVLKGSGTSYTLKLTNTGDQPILCMAFDAVTPVTILSATSPGLDVKVFNSNAFRSNLTLGPGENATFSFSTGQVYPEGLGGDLYISGDCKNFTLLNASGPTPSTVSPPPPPTPTTKTRPPPPPPKAKKCRCASLTVKVDPTLLTGKPLPPTGRQFGIGFSWHMICVGIGPPVKGAKCRSRVDFLPPEILAGTLPASKNLRLNLTAITFFCNGICPGSTFGRFEVKMLSPNQLNKLFGRTLAFRLRLFCIVNGVAVPKGTVTINIVIDSKGRMKLKR
jgi:hypothetical protein